MAGSQVDNLNTVAGLSGLFHSVFNNKIVPNLAHMAASTGVFRRAGPKDYTMVGSAVYYAGQLRASGGAMSTSGQLPDHQYTQPVPFNTSPVRSYVRRAMDNFVKARGVDPGVYGNFADEITRDATEAFERKMSFDAHAGSSAILCKVASRTSATVVVVDDGYGHTGTNPLMFIEIGDTLAWLDATDSYAYKGAAKVSAINYTTKAITFGTAFDDASTVPADGDLIVRATTTGTAPLSTIAGHFVTEYGLGPQGFRDILDPDSDNSSYNGVAEATYIRNKPARVASVSWGEVEFMDFIQQINASGNTQVAPDSHVLTCQGAVLNELARTLVSFTQIREKGQELAGGWTTVRLAGFDFLEDGYHTHDELMCHCLDDYVVVDMSGDAQVFTGDGNQMTRIDDWDAIEYYMYWYGQRFAERRNRSGTLTGISISNYTADTFAAVPR